MRKVMKLTPFLDQVPHERFSRQSVGSRCGDRQAPVGFYKLALSRSVMYASNTIDVTMSELSSPSLVLRSCPTCSASFKASFREL